MRSAILLRGINLGATNRVPMPALREALTAAGLRDVRTYVQSGNIVCDHDGAPEHAAALAARVIEERFGVSAPVLTRSSSELQAVVVGNPFDEPATSAPKQYQVSFLSGALAEEAIATLEARRRQGESVAVSTSGREVYAWHPGGIHASKLAAALTDRKLGVTATARNWATVTTLLRMTAEP